MATNTSLTFLMYKASSSATTYSKLADIKSYPNFGGDREALETTTLSNVQRTYIPGIAQTADGKMKFPANYVKTDYTTIRALEEAGSELNLAIWMGGTVSGSTVTPTGDEGKWEFKGYISVGLVGKGVNEVREMEIGIMPSTEIVPAAE